MGCFLAFYHQLYAQRINPIQLVVGAAGQSNVSVLPGLQDVPGNNQIVEGLNALSSLPDVPTSQSILTIVGSMLFNGNSMTISLPTSMSDLQVVGGVSITLPAQGSLQILVDGVPQPIPSTISVAYSNPDQVFSINASVNLSGSFMLFSSHLAVSVHGALSVTGTPSQSRIAIAGESIVNVDQDISFHEATVTLRGDIASRVGNISMVYNLNNTGDFGVDSTGTITASEQNSISFTNNSSTISYGVYIQSGIVQAGTINFIGNSGQEDFAGVRIDGSLYTNSFNVTTDCTSSNQKFILNTIVYEYSDHAKPLPSSQISVNNLGCYNGTLQIAGNIAFRDNSITISVDSVADITVAGFVVLDIPIGGNLMINDTPYDGTIPGLLVAHGQQPNHFDVQGDLVAIVVNIAGSVTVGAGLTTADDICIASGSLTLPIGATTFSAGGDIWAAHGAALSLPSTLTTNTLFGRLSGQGDITINSELNIPCQASASTFTIGASVNVSRGLTTSGNVTVNNGVLSMAGNGLQVTGGDILVRAGGSLYIASGGIGVHNFGSIIFEDNSAGFYSGQIFVESGDFTMGSGASFLVSGGGISLGGTAVMTLRSPGTTGADLVARSLYVGAEQQVEGWISVIGGSLSIDSDVVVTAGVLMYDGSENEGSFFTNLGTVQTSGGVFILNSNNNDRTPVTTGAIAAGGSLTISNNVCNLPVAYAVLISGNISGVDIRIDNNSSAHNSITVFCQDYTIEAGGLLEIIGNRSLQGGTSLFLVNGTVSAGSTITINDNDAGGGSSVGVYIACVVKTSSSITMNNNIGTVYGVRIADGAIQTDSTFTIMVSDEPTQNFNSSAVTMTLTDGSTSLPFSSFLVRVGLELCPTYEDIPNDRVILAVANRVS